MPKRAKKEGQTGQGGMNHRFNMPEGSNTHSADRPPSICERCEGVYDDCDGEVCPDCQREREERFQEIPITEQSRAATFPAVGTCDEAAKGLATDENKPLMKTRRGPDEEARRDRDTAGNTLPASFEAWLKERTI